MKRSRLRSDQDQIGPPETELRSREDQDKKLILIFWALILQQLRGGYVGSVSLHFTEAEVSITMGSKTNPVSPSRTACVHEVAAAV